MKSYKIWFVSINFLWLKYVNNYLKDKYAKNRLPQVCIAWIDFEALTGRLINWFLIENMKKKSFKKTIPNKSIDQNQLNESHVLLLWIPQKKKMRGYYGLSFIKLIFCFWIYTVLCACLQHFHMSHNKYEST